jgi:ribosome maturation factor RimP
MMRTADTTLTALVESVVEPMGYDAVGVELAQTGGSGSVLRVYIDHERGITLDDCEAVSRQLSSVLDVDDPVAGHYDLEVSSPGLDRLLFKPADFERFKGARAHIRLAEKLGGRRRFDGILAGVDGSNVVLDVSGESMTLPFDLIDSARLVPEF